MKGAGWSPGNDDQQIWYTTTADGHTFADQAIVPGALTVSKPALAALPGTGLSLPPGPCVPAPSASLDTVPSTGAGRDLMLMAVQAVQGLDDEYVATSAFDGTSWTAPARITGGSGPVLAWVGGKSDRPQRKSSWPAPDHAGRRSGGNATLAAAGEPGNHRWHRYPHLPALVFAGN
jgi:hypothetical protein